jgi:hypothetical protein
MPGARLTIPQQSTSAVAPTKPWSKQTWTALLCALTCCTLLIHGYHPLAEDGGLYVAGIQYTLDPSLFPHYTDFVREHLRFSVFAPIIATTVHLTHLPLLWILFLLDLLSIWLTLFSVRQILRRVLPSASPAAHLAGIALLAAWWTMPIAGTSLLLMDPYLTARSFSTPLSLLAIAYAFDASYTRAALCLILAAALHPLMAAYALAFLIVLYLSRVSRPLKARILSWLALTVAALVLAALLQSLAPPERSALRAAAITRYYWFLSQWQWYERIGLLGPLAILAGILYFRRDKLSTNAVTLCHTCLVLAAIVILTAILFAHENSTVHLVARLQVLRVYLLIYAIMTILLGATLCQITKRPYPIGALILAMAAIMFYVQRQSFPLSPQIELPWRAESNTNPWVQAFLWAQHNTPKDALFALDAKYVNTDGEDAQTFRATALRSALPDYSKDGGEASITPALAPVWQQASTAQKDLSELTDATRDGRLRPYAVTWMVLHSNTQTTHPCPYINRTVKICSLTP